MHDEFIAVATHFLNIVHTMHERCSSSLEVIFFSLAVDFLYYDRVDTTVSFKFFSVGLGSLHLNTCSF